MQPEYSTVNYKDALGRSLGKSPVVRRLCPMVPGIDGAGTVLASRHRGLGTPGDQASCTDGRGVGETRWGGLAEVARSQGRVAGLVRLPAAFTARQAMAIGTAGYTAMLCVLALEHHGMRAGRRARCW